MASFDERIEKECRDGRLPGAILIGGDKSGKYRYEKAFGVRSLKTHSPMEIDNTMWMASCSKLITTIAAMQCVERGLLELDVDVTTILPELKGIKIFKGFEAESKKPILVDSKVPITLRQLLTHSSGFTYDMFNPVMMQYRISTGFTPQLSIKGDIKEAFTFPLVFEPGEEWGYGVGIDWAGWMVERVTGVPLEEYIRKNILEPLDATSFTLYPKHNPKIMDKLVDMSLRQGGATAFTTPADPNGTVEHTDDGIWNLDNDSISPGAGGYGTVLDYQKILQSLCTDDEKLLKKVTTAEMFKPQLSEKGAQIWMDACTIPEVNNQLGGMPLGVKSTWGIGGAILQQDLPNGLKKGTMYWCGYPNLSWFCDREAGMSGIFGTQLYMPGDQKVAQLYIEWQKEMYEKAGKY